MRLAKNSMQSNYKFEIAQEQFKIISSPKEGKSRMPYQPLRSGTDMLKIEGNENMVEILLGDSLEPTRIATIDKSNGSLSSYTTPCGFEAMPHATSASMVPNYPRAIIDNDRGGVDLITKLMPGGMRTDPH